MKKFSACIEIIGVNPFVFVPVKILDSIFKKSGKEKGAIPICGTVNEKFYRQTLVKYSGEWRLYINTTMLKNSPKRIGEKIFLTIDFDEEDRTIPIHPELQKALNENIRAKQIFLELSPSRRKEIVRYIHHLKSESIRQKNIEKAIDFLLGKAKFVGRDKP